MKEVVLTSRQMRLCDEHTINARGVPSLVLMERAADAVVDNIINEGFDISNTVVVCGGGNNGGDGFAAARFLSEAARRTGADARIRCFFAGGGEDASEQCTYQRAMAEKSGIEEMSSFDAQGVTLIIDALFGIGLSRPVEGEYKAVVDAINASGAKVVSVDIPSGINASSGEVMGVAVKADLTVTMSCYKLGQLLYPGAEKCGKLIKADIGIGTEAVSADFVAETAVGGAPVKLKARKPDSNKGDYGCVLVVGGAKGMAGAAYLAALSAYRCGAGLVRIFTCEENRAIIQGLLPEAVLTVYNAESEIETLLSDALERASSVVIGPGLSKSKEAVLQLETVLNNASCPIVADADALNILAERKDLFGKVKGKMIITPHMGEMSRLTGESVGKLKANAISAAKDFASEHGIVCCMKDARTVISDGERAYVNVTGTSGLSKGGSGDVLSGIIGAFAATGMDLYDSACLGSYLHGRAGELASRKLTEYSLLARDIADHLSEAINESL